MPTDYAAEVSFQGAISLRDVGLIYLAGFSLIIGICAWQAVPMSHYGLVFLSALAFSSVLLMALYNKLKTRSRRMAVVSFRSPVLFIPDQEPFDLSRAHSLSIVETQGNLAVRVHSPVLATIALEGISRREAEESFDAPWFIESRAHPPMLTLALELEHIDFSRALLAVSGRSRMNNLSFAVWNSYPWDEPYDPRPLPPDATPDSLQEQAVWPDRKIGVSASYLFFQEDQGWRILPLGGGLEISLETDSSVMRRQGGVPVKYVYVQLRSAQVQARICMEDSGSVHEGASEADSRRAFLAFVNSRTRLESNSVSLTS